MHMIGLNYRTRTIFINEDSLAAVERELDRLRIQRHDAAPGTYQGQRCQLIPASS